MDPFTERVAKFKEIFQSLKDPEERYSYLIELGRKAAPYPPEHQTASHIVPGCQSILYLHARVEEGKLYFTARSEALISAGLAALLVAIYSDSAPQTILLNPPVFLQEIGLLATLSPSRSNGFASIYQRMQQEALKQIR